MQGCLAFATWTGRTIRKYLKTLPALVLLGLACALQRGRLSLSDFASSSGYSAEVVSARAQLLQRKLRHAQILGGDLIDDSFFQAVAEYAESVLEVRVRGEEASTPGLG